MLCLHTVPLISSRADVGGPSELLWGIDPLKDQSYFLAAVPGTAFRDVIFPLGTWLKADVRRAATVAGVPSADRRSSAGICFIGAILILSCLKT